MIAFMRRPESPTAPAVVVSALGLPAVIRFVGNRLSMTTAGGTTSYTYDDNYRLIRATRPDGSYTDYAYDAAGNRTQMTATTGGTSETPPTPMT